MKFYSKMNYMKIIFFKIINCIYEVIISLILIVILLILISLVQYFIKYLTAIFCSIFSIKTLGYLFIVYFFFNLIIWLVIVISISSILNGDKF